MLYRTLPRGGEQISILGLGANGLAENKKPEEIQPTVEMAIEMGVNFFDLAGGNAEPFVPIGKAIKGRRDKVYLQMHFGADYSRHNYGWTMNVSKIEHSVEEQFRALDTDYTDFGFIHCIDEEEDLEKVVNGGILDMIQKYKSAGKVRHIGISSHNPAIIGKALDMVSDIDLVMFSINPAYDYTNIDYGMGEVGERMQIYRRCERDGVGISVMKPYGGGTLLDAERSPFRFALTPYQCIQYALDKPGVLTVLPGIGDRDALKEYLGFLEAPSWERDYSVLGTVSPKNAKGMCVYCNHCAPCPQEIEIGLINKYYDLSKAGDNMAAEHYRSLNKHADDCISCGHCDSRCPFKVAQSDRMKEIVEYFKKV